MKRRQSKLFEFADLDDQEEPMTVRRPRNRSDSNSSGVPPETTPLTLLSGPLKIFILKPPNPNCGPYQVVGLARETRVIKR